MPRAVVCAFLVSCVAFGGTACSPKKMGISRMADALTSTTSAFSRDDDPEFVRLAAPSTLKMVEMLLDEQPSHPGLLMTACSGFTEYAYAFLQVEAEVRADSDLAGARELRTRAAHMYDRAGAYCGRALSLRHPQFVQLGAGNPLPRTTVADVPVLYWTAVAWGGKLSVSDNQLQMIGSLVKIRQLLTRALELDERWSDGAIHEAMIALDGLPVLLGGSASRARTHFDRALVLSENQSAFAYVTMATSVAQPARNRAEFERLLRAALDIDVSKRPSLRLVNLIAQRRARFLLSRLDRLFR